MKVVLGVSVAMTFVTCWLVFAFTAGPVSAIKAHNAALASVATR